MRMAPIFPLLETEQARAYRSLSDFLPMLRVSAVSVEKAHLVGRGDECGLVVLPSPLTRCVLDLTKASG